jgi:hypothetical protein
MSASFALASGANGFFTARPLVPWLQPAGTIVGFGWVGGAPNDGREGILAV